MYNSSSGSHSTYVLRCVVQHHVHELIIPAQHARDTSVGVELDCTRRNVSTMDVNALALCALCRCPRVSSLNGARARSPRRQRFRSERHSSGHSVRATAHRTQWQSACTSHPRHSRPTYNPTDPTTRRSCFRSPHGAPGIRGSRLTQTFSQSSSVPAWNTSARWAPASRGYETQGGKD